MASSPPGTVSRRRRSRRRGDASAEVSHRDRWIVSYADFITLLFAFFTTMYAVSTVDAHKLNRIVTAMQSAFAARSVQVAPGIAPTGVAFTAPGIDTIAHPDDAERSLSRASPRELAGDAGLETTLEQVRQRLVQELRAELSHGEVTIAIDQRGLLISIPESASFPSGSAVLSDPARALFARIGKQLLPVGNLVRVEGHTDDAPIRTTKYASNWELSTSRATNVVAYLTEAVGMPASRLSAAGYGQFRPRSPNATPAARAANRRVDLVVLNPATARAEEPQEAGK